MRPPPAANPAPTVRFADLLSSLFARFAGHLVAYLARSCRLSKSSNSASRLKLRELRNLGGGEGGKRAINLWDWEKGPFRLLDVIDVEERGEVGK